MAFNIYFVCHRLWAFETVVRRGAGIRAGDGFVDRGMGRDYADVSAEGSFHRSMENNHMAKVKMPHVGHDKHLCYLRNVGYLESHLKEYKELVREANYVCKVCGRVATSSGSLCKPVKI
jgi:hypothetical protein